MHVRTTTRDAEEPLFDHDLAPASPGSIEEFVLTDDSEFGRGDRRFLLLDGIVITRRRHTILRDFDLWNEQEAPVVTLRFCLQGAVQARMRSFAEEVQTQAGEHTLVYTPERAYTHVLRRDSVHDVVEVYVTMDYIAALTERHPELLETYFSSIARQEPFRFQGGRFSISPQMRSAIHQILCSHDHGPLRRLFIEAKVTELLALQLRHYEQREASMPGAVDLSKRAIDRMIEARDYVVSRMDAPPTLPELARQVGTNEFALKRDFKAVFGTTVYGLLLDYKLEHTRTLLLDTDRSIAEIAREVGYSHPAHFSTAFKKKYGVSPSAMRRGG